MVDDTPQGKAPRVLIADDNAFMRSKLSEILRDAGCQVIGEAGDGVQAVALYAELAPDVVTMDLVMPEMEGLEAIRLIIEADPDARIIVCSAMGSDDLVSSALETGALDFLIKPYQVERVVDAVKAAMPGAVFLASGSSAVVDRSDG